MRAVNIQQAKTHLSRLVEQAEAGEDIVIAKAGRPCVRLVPVKRDEAPRELGRLRGTLQVADDFDAPSTTIEDLFGGIERPAVPRRQRRSSGRKAR